MTKDILRFFFDYSAGGCLWAGDAATQAKLGVGPLDATVYDLEGRALRQPKVILSAATCQLRDWVDAVHSHYPNPHYQLDPSLWTQEACDSFNANVDRLLVLLLSELDGDFQILDQQPRYVEDPALGEYLLANPEISAVKDISGSMVR